MYFFYFSFNKLRLKKLKPMLLQMARLICENFYCMMSKVKGSGSEGLDLEEVKKEIAEMMKQNGLSFTHLELNCAHSLE
jgi:hypothetical protein